MVTLRASYKAASHYAKRVVLNSGLTNFKTAINDSLRGTKLDHNHDVKASNRKSSAHMSLKDSGHTYFSMALISGSSGFVAPPAAEYQLGASTNRCAPLLLGDGAGSTAKNNQSIKAKAVQPKKEFTDYNMTEEAATSGQIEFDYDVDLITVEDDYTGPRFDEGKMTLQFMKDLMEYFKNKQKLHRKYVFKILRKVRNYYRRQPALLDIKVPRGQNISICGDIHGQLYDLLNIFKINGLPSDTNRYLFNGDFVNRGRYSVESALILFGFKLLYPNRFYINRGNHETKMMCHYFGFNAEVRFKYSKKMQIMFSEVFQWLPLAHNINGRVLVIHAGLFGKDGVTLADIKHIERHCEPVHNDLMFDMLWSDPKSSLGRSPNFMRGAGIEFGPDVTRAFCIRNQIDFIIRSHFPAKEGYASEHSGRLITVFSAPNYYGGNKGGIAKLRSPDLEPQFITFTQTPEPTWETTNIVKEYGVKDTEGERSKRETESPLSATTLSKYFP